jgi:predicted permease
MKTSLADLGRDLAYSLRTMRRQPVFTAAAVGVLAAAIGGNTAVFGLVDAALLRDLPYRDPATLAALSHETPGAYSTSLPLPLIQAWRQHSRGLSDVAACYQTTGISRVTLTGAEPESIKAGFVEARMFRVLGVSPALGRAFSDREQADGERVAVLGAGFWKRRFGGARAAVGNFVEIDGVPTRVVGVMPERFEFPDRTVQLWLPLTLNRTWRRDAADQARYWWIAVGRLAPGWTRANVEAELTSIAMAAPSQPRVERIRVRPLNAGVASSSRLTLLTLFGAIAAVLLIACANLAALLVARGQARRRELAVRAAIGASRARLVRQLLAECLALATLAGVLAVPLAETLLGLFLEFGPTGVPRLDQARLDVRALLFLAGCCGSTVLLFGLLPALRTTAWLRLNTREAGSEPGSWRLRAALASLQLALGVVLLSAAGLLMRSFLAARSVELGFEPQRTLVVRAQLPGEATATRRSGYYQEVLDRLRAVPGVLAAGAIDELFELNEPPRLSLRAIEGREAGSPPLPLKWTTVTGDYFRAVGVRLLEGRSFDTHDTATSPRVVVVDQSFARRFFPGEGAQGRRFKGQDARGRDDEWLTIVGVVADMRREGLERQPSPHVFEWAAQTGEATPDLLVRTAADPAAAASAVRAAVRGVDGTAVIESVATLDSQLAEQLTGRRFQSALLFSFALLGLGLAGLGVFGVVHYAVSHRVREIGVRLALGATQRDVTTLFMRRFCGPLLLGGCVGLAGAVAVSRVLAALLFGVRPLDPLTHALSFCTLMLVAVLASLVPVARASRLDPPSALREE